MKIIIVYDGTVKASHVVNHGPGKAPEENNDNKSEINRSYPCTHQQTLHCRICGF